MKKRTRTYLIIFAIYVITTTTFIMIICAIHSDNKQKHQDSQQQITIDVETDDGGYFNAYADVELSYRNGQLAVVSIWNPTLLSFKIPERYQDGVSLVNGEELQKILARTRQAESFLQDGDIENAIYLLNDNLASLESIPVLNYNP